LAELELDARQQVLELLRAQKRDELVARRRLHLERIERDRERRVHVEQDETLRDARLLGEIDETLPALRLLDLRSARQQRLEIAIGVDELGRGLDADARHAR